METDPQEVNELPENRKSPTFKILFLAFAPVAVALAFPGILDFSRLDPYIFLAANIFFSLATAHRLMSFTKLQKAPFVLATIAYGLVVFVVNCFLGSLVMFIRTGGHM